MTTATDERTDIEILANLDFEESEPTCDYLECQETATSKLVCGICSQGCELMCEPHTAYTREAQIEAPLERIVFTETCGHAPFFETCEITAL